MAAYKKIESLWKGAPLSMMPIHAQLQIHWMMTAATLDYWIVRKVRIITAAWMQVKVIQISSVDCCL